VRTSRLTSRYRCLLLLSRPVATIGTLCNYRPELQAPLGPISPSGSRRLSDHPTVLLDAVVLDERYHHLSLAIGRDGDASDDHIGHHGVRNLCHSRRADRTGRHASDIYHVVVPLSSSGVGALISRRWWWRDFPTDHSYRFISSERRSLHDQKWTDGSPFVLGYKRSTDFRWVWWCIGFSCLCCLVSRFVRRIPW
jgi:hypothetical protein